MVVIMIHLKVNIFVDGRQLHKEKSLKPILTKSKRLIGIKGNIQNINSTITCSVAYFIKSADEYKLLVKHATKSLASNHLSNIPFYDQHSLPVAAMVPNLTAIVERVRLNRNKTRTVEAVDSQMTPADRSGFTWLCFSQGFGVSILLLIVLWFIAETVSRSNSPILF